MIGLKNRLRSLDIEGWIFGLTGLAAVVFSLLGFFGLWSFDQLQTIQILIGAIGILMLAVVSLTAKRQAEILEIKNALGVCETHLLPDIEYWQNLALNIRQSKKFVLDTFLNWATPRHKNVSYISGTQYEYQKLLFERVTNRSLSFRQIQVVYHKQGLEELIHRLLLLEDGICKIRHYDPPPIAIPMLHLASFDDEIFYLGVGYPKGTPADNCILYIRESKTHQLFKNYWNALWESAIPLNEGGIDWKELKRIGSRLGITDDEFDSMVLKVKDDVERDRKRLLQRW